MTTTLTLNHTSITSAANIQRYRIHFEPSWEITNPLIILNLIALFKFFSCYPSRFPELFNLQQQSSPSFQTRVLQQHEDIAVHS